MDQVRITRPQLRELAKKDVAVTILADNQDAGMLLVVPTNYEGDNSKWKWLQANGRYQKRDK